MTLRELYERWNGVVGDDPMTYLTAQASIVRSDGRGCVRWRVYCQRYEVLANGVRRAVGPCVYTEGDDCDVVLAQAIAAYRALASKAGAAAGAAEDPGDPTERAA